MNAEKKQKLLAQLAAISGVLMESDEIFTPEETQILGKANDVAWNHRKGTAEDFYRQAKEYEQEYK